KNAVVGEIDLEALLSMKTSPVKAPIPSKFPSVSRDLAFLIDEDVPFLDVERELKKGDKLISSVEVFDLYQGANILFGKKSMAITITFLDPEKTLKDEEIKLSMSKAISLLKQKFGAEVRQ
ncbi:MAG TPA: phenylalanine--tRNA ligase subunit beta, partial [Firmicutes bacterium]|nr:phenylalanine--tRNA ligase subunit beta [Bacillota bacterium]